MYSTAVPLFPYTSVIHTAPHSNLFLGLCHRFTAPVSLVYSFIVFSSLSRSRNMAGLVYYALVGASL